MERCRCDWLESLGLNVINLQENHDIAFVVREANIKFELPAKLFDELSVTLEPLQVGKVRLLLEQKIYNQQQLLCQAEIKLATLQHSSFKLTSMPATLRQVLAVNATKR